MTDVKRFVTLSPGRFQEWSPGLTERRVSVEVEVDAARVGRIVALHLERRSAGWSGGTRPVDVQDGNVAARIIRLIRVGFTAKT
jgi:hypothetical protein